MSAFKAIFLLSLLAIFLAPRQTEAQGVIKPEWSKFAKCSQLLIESVSHLARNVVPTVQEINTCTGYVVVIPPRNSRSPLWYAKISLEFLKKFILDKPDCVPKLLNKVSATLQPYVNQIQSVGCLDEDDYFY